MIPAAGDRWEPAERVFDDPGLQRDLYLHALVRTYWYLRADFSELTMAQFESSGGLLLITDKSVRDAMLTYQQGLEVCKHQFLQNQKRVGEDLARLIRASYGLP